MTILEMLEMPTPQLKHLLSNIAGCTNGVNYTFVPGSPETPFVLVSHIDTVERGKVTLSVTSNVIKNKTGALGADDRAGVFAALKIYQNAVVKPHLLFTDMEEVGGIGAKEVCDTLPCPAGVKLLVELDRRGCNEWVAYDQQHKKVKKYIERFGFIEDFGSYSDIADIGPAWNKASVNLSIGYYHQHTVKETLHVDEMELTIQRVLRMTEDPIAKDYPPPEDEYYGFCDRRHDGWGFMDYRTKGKAQKACAFCYEIPKAGAKLTEYDGMMMCADCFEWLSTKDHRAENYFY